MPCRCDGGLVRPWSRSDSGVVGVCWVLCVAWLGAGVSACGDGCGMGCEQLWCLLVPGGKVAVLDFNNSSQRLAGAAGAL